MRRSLPIIYLAINVACALVVLYAAHRVPALMTLEHRTASDGVDGVEFFTLSAPAFAIAAVTNAAWTGRAVVDLWYRRGRHALWWLAAAVAVWSVAMLASRGIAG